MISKNESREELQKRQYQKTLIRRGDSWQSYLYYAEYVFKYKYKKPFRRTWWDPLVAQMAVDIIWGVTKRAILEIPPRHGKTERGMRLLSSLAQALDNQTSFIYMTYGETLFKLTCSETKEIMEDECYKELFPRLSFSSKINTNTHWLLTGGGGMLGTSTKGGATGLPANILIPDDLLKAVDADSKSSRDAAWDAYKSSGVSRLEGKQQAILMIGQRLHKDDPNGRAREEGGLAEDGGVWHVLSLPVLNNFYEFYNWIEQKNEKEFVSATDEQIRQITEKSLDTARQEVETFIRKNPTESEREIDRIRQESVPKHFYLEAKKMFLSLFLLESEMVRYRDMEVERPPLTCLDAEAFGLHVIIQKRKELGKRMFDTQYLQDVEEEEAGYFVKEHTRYAMDIDVPEQYLSIIVDTAESLDSAADERAIGVYGKSTDASRIPKTILMDGRRGIWDIIGTSKNIIVLALRYPDAQILIEGAGGGISLEVILRREILVYNAMAQAKNKPQVSNPIFAFKPDNSKGAKNQRIKLINAPREQGYFLIYEGCDVDFKEKFIKDLLAFNPEKRTNKDNTIDTAGLSYSRQECAIKVNLPPPSKAIKRHGYGEQSNKWRGV